MESAKLRPAGERMDLSGFGTVFCDDGMDESFTVAYFSMSFR
jgi:hypothetical protein